MVWLSSPEVAVTVSVKMPAGVPGVPPQEDQSLANSTTVANPVVAIRMTDAAGRETGSIPFGGGSKASLGREVHPPQEVLENGALADVLG